MAVLGFDFGTTNCLFSMIKGDRPTSYFDDMGLPTPSVVCYEGTTVLTGRAAKERMASAGLGVHGNIVRSPKRLLGTDSVVVDGVERAVVDVARDLVNGVRDAALSGKSRDLPDFDMAVVTIPVDFEGYKRAALRDACNRAGLRIFQFVHEPLAALYGFFRNSQDTEDAIREYQGRFVLVFDWGGGTLDLTLCRIDGNTILQIANDGTDDVGGDLFDEAIRAEILRSIKTCATSSDLPETHPDAMARLLHRCELAKIDLSTRESVEIYVNHFFRNSDDDSLEFTLSRAGLDDICKPLVLSGIKRIDSLLAGAGVLPSQVSMCLATGGMNEMPLIKFYLQELFGPRRVKSSQDGIAATAQGAAWIAHDTASLRLAKNIEVNLARNTHLSLIHAGAVMPTERQVQSESCLLYCVDPRDGFGKIQLACPHRPGPRVMPNDARAHIASLSVRVHKEARPLLERIELNLHIDDNLILHTRARSTIQGDVARAEVHNLEFGISIGINDEKIPAELPEVIGKESLHEPGAVTVRSNVSKEASKSDVPGELWYKHAPQDFDTRHNPPRIQVEERLYYEPCSRCGRMINDPDCNCGTASNSGNPSLST